MKKLSIFAVTAVLSGLSGIHSVQAFNPQPDPPARFGMLGIVSGQTARLHVVALPTPSDVSPGPCRVELSFRDSNGTLVEQVGNPTQVTLQPGHAAFLDIHGYVDPDQRVEVHPLVRVRANSTTVAPCRGVVGSVEVFDDVTGRSSVLIEDPGLYTDPSIRTLAPAHFGMLGLVSGQTARLNAFALPVSGGVTSGPCRVALSFLDNAGNPIGTLSPIVSILPGHAAFLDLPGFGSTELREAVRPRVQVLTTPISAGVCGGVVGSVEVFDVTGVTSVLYSDPNLFLP